MTTAALTDHDTVDGSAPLEEAVRDRGIRIIPGEEESVEHEGQDLHILAYYVDRGDDRLLAMLRKIRDSRRVRVQGMVARLGELGIPVTEAEVLRRAACSESVGRVHVAQALVENQWVGHHGDAFRYYIGAEGPAYRPKETAGIEECLAILREGGAFSVLAHPGSYRLASIVERLVEAGVDGWVVCHPALEPAGVAHREDRDHRGVEVRDDRDEAGGRDLERRGIGTRVAHVEHAQPEERGETPPADDEQGTASLS